VTAWSATALPQQQGEGGPSPPEGGDAANAPTAGDDGPSVEIELEVISFVRPRALRLLGAASAAATVAETDVPFVNATLWAYYAACCDAEAGGPPEPPWDRPDPVWRAFEAAVRDDPEQPLWWADPDERLRRLWAAFQRVGGRGGGRAAQGVRDGLPPAGAAADEPSLYAEQTLVTPEGYRATVRARDGATAPVAWTTRQSQVHAGVQWPSPLESPLAARGQRVTAQSAGRPPTSAPGTGVWRWARS